MCSINLWTVFFLTRFSPNTCVFLHAIRPVAKNFEDFSRIFLKYFNFCKQNFCFFLLVSNQFILILFIDILTTCEHVNFVGECITLSIFLCRFILVTGFCRKTWSLPKSWYVLISYVLCSFLLFCSICINVARLLIHNPKSEWSPIGSVNTGSQLQTV